MSSAYDALDGFYGGLSREEAASIREEQEGLSGAANDLLSWGTALNSPTSRENRTEFAIEIQDTADTVLEEGTALDSPTAQRNLSALGEGDLSVLVPDVPETPGVGPDVPWKLVGGAIVVGAGLWLARPALEIGANVTED